MPYLWTMKGYKGDFLWRTSDVAIWTTVEIGVGITAGCVATLKPLLKSCLQLMGVHSSMGPDSGAPWSTTKKSGPGIQAYSRHAQALDNLRPANDKSMTTTTVTGRGLSNNHSKGLSSWNDHGDRDSSEEHIIPESVPMGREFLDVQTWKGGINKSVEVTTTEERNAPLTVASSRFTAEDMDEDRSLRNKPAVVYERI